MHAEFWIFSPLVPTREDYFVRYCKKHSYGIQVVVDVSLDNLQNPSLVIRCRKKPSGCLLQNMPDSYSKVTWVEHVEADDRVVHHIYHHLVNFGMDFSTKLWVTTLQMQCEHMVSVLANSILTRDLGVIPRPEGRKNTLKFVERMVTSFCIGVSAHKLKNLWLLS